MKDTTVGLWCLKADNDFKAGSDQLETESPATDTVCFHMQQCVEKYLKAFLVSNEMEISKTHNLTILLQKCVEINSDFNNLKELNIGILTAYAVDMRYPDDFYMPTIEESNHAKNLALKIRGFVSERLPNR